jgi:hypothetical protein
MLSYYLDEKMITINNHLAKYDGWRRMAFFLAIIGVVQFFVLCAIAMLFYPGGTELNPNIKGYSFFMNAYSDLGRIYSPSGISNTISRLFYVIALISINVLLIPFYFSMNYFFRENDTKRIFSLLATICGIISAMFGIGTALFPVDLFPTIHLFFALIFGLFSSFMLGLYTVPILLHQSYPNRYGYVNISYAVLLVIYMLLVSINPVPTTELGLIILTTGQKLILISGFFCIFILAFGALRRYNISI